MLKNFLKDERGQGMTEYILIIGVLAVAGIALFAAFKDKLQEVFTSVGETLSNAVGGGN